MFHNVFLLRSFDFMMDRLKMGFSEASERYVIVIIQILMFILRIQPIISDNIRKLNISQIKFVC